MTRPVGLNLRLADLDEIESTAPAVDFWEVIAENLFDRPDLVDRIAALDRPISIHAVGTNLAGEEPVELSYLRRLRSLVDAFDVILVSDHLCWQRHGGIAHHDLLPFPRRARCLPRLIERIDLVQDHLGRAIAIENLCAYVEFTASTIPEHELLQELAERTNCGILLDLNNLEVNEHNLGVQAEQVLNHLDLSRVAELHVAGAEAQDHLLIDTHGAEPTERQRRWIQDPKLCDVPVCYERDQHRPPLAERLATVSGLRR